MPEKHLLLKYGTTYERFSGSLAPTGCSYDRRVGAWVVSGTDTLFVETPNREGPKTKKMDIETGEDQKAE